MNTKPQSNKRVMKPPIKATPTKATPSKATPLKRNISSVESTTDEHLPTKDPKIESGKSCKYKECKKDSKLICEVCIVCKGKFCMEHVKFCNTCGLAICESCCCVDDIETYCSNICLVATFDPSPQKKVNPEQSLFEESPEHISDESPSSINERTSEELTKEMITKPSILLNVKPIPQQISIFNGTIAFSGSRLAKILVEEMERRTKDSGGKVEVVDVVDDISSKVLHQYSNKLYIYNRLEPKLTDKMLLAIIYGFKIVNKLYWDACIKAEYFIEPLENHLITIISAKIGNLSVSDIYHKHDKVGYKLFRDIYVENPGSQAIHTLLTLYGMELKIGKCCKVIKLSDRLLCEISIGEIITAFVTSSLEHIQGKIDLIQSKLDLIKQSKPKKGSKK